MGWIPISYLENTDATSIKKKTIRFMNKPEIIETLQSNEERVGEKSNIGYKNMMNSKTIEVTYAEVLRNRLYVKILDVATKSDEDAATYSFLLIQK